MPSVARAVPHFFTGVRFCPKCRTFLNRDLSAALNIAYLYCCSVLLEQPEWPEPFRARTAEYRRLLRVRHRQQEEAVG